MATAQRSPGGQRPRRRARGRLAPLNGSVTRDDIRAIYDEAKRMGPSDPPMTPDEAIAIVIGAIVDWSPSPSQRARMSAKASHREAVKRRKGARRTQLSKGGLVRRP